MPNENENVNMSAEQAPEYPAAAVEGAIPEPSADQIVQVAPDQYAPEQQVFVDQNGMAQDVQQAVDPSVAVQPEGLEAAQADLAGAAGQYTKKTEYHNIFAKIVGTLGSIFPEDSSIGYGLRKLADKLEARGAAGHWTQEDHAATRESMTREIASRSGVEQVSADSVKAMNDIKGQDSAQFVQELRDMSSGQLTPDMPGSIAKLQERINENTSISPVATGNSIVAFNAMAQQHIDQVYGTADSAERSAALQDLANINKQFVTAYYGALMDREKSGLALSGRERELIDNMQLGAVEKYSAYIPGADVAQIVPEEQRASVMQQHDQIIAAADQYVPQTRENYNDTLRKGSTLRIDSAQSKDPNAFYKWEANAQRAVESKVFELSGEPNSRSLSFKKSHISIGQEIRDLRNNCAGKIGNIPGMSEEDKARGVTYVAGQYMDFMRGVQAYNNRAVDEIERRYASDPKGKEAATIGLARSMRVIVGDSWSAVKNDNDVRHFLSDEDKKELDDMRFTGVNMKYSEYTPGADLHNYKKEDYGASLSLEEAVASDYTAEERQRFGMYGSAGIDDPIEPEGPRQPAAEAVDVNASEKRSGRVAQAMQSSVISKAVKNAGKAATGPSVDLEKN